MDQKSVPKGGPVWSVQSRRRVCSVREKETEFGGGGGEKKAGVEAVHIPKATGGGRHGGQPIY